MNEDQKMSADHDGLRPADAPVAEPAPRRDDGVYAIPSYWDGLPKGHPGRTLPRGPQSSSAAPRRRRTPRRAPGNTDRDDGAST
jgi:hypothetical protein